MNYRHVYHAGNHADVLKHVVLTLILRHLALKPAPYRVIDTHAGVGRYDLRSGRATKTEEWRDGIGRLWGGDAPSIRDPAIEELLADYFSALAADNPSGRLLYYPGSPRIAIALMRGQDRLVANELHPEDGAALARLLAREKRATVLRLDGWTALKASLPPKERRGVVLIDPPYEVAGELDRLLDAIGEAQRRFATGVVLLWYPLKDQAAIDDFRSRLWASGPAKLLVAELRVRRAGDEGLAGSGMAVVNPPHTLQPGLRLLLPFLAERLATGPGNGWRLEAREVAR